MEQASKPNWAEDVRDLMGHQYGALENFLIHTEDVGHQHVNLYFTVLVAALGVLGVALTEVPTDVSRSWRIFLVATIAGLLFGIYTYASVLQSRYIAFMLRIELDSLTFSWLRQRSDDVAYYHLRDLVEWIQCPTGKRGRPSRNCRWRMLGVIFNLLRSCGVWLKRTILQVKRQPRQLLFITSVNSACTGIILWLLASPPYPLALPSGFLGYALEWIQLGGTVAVAFVSGFVWIVQVFIYVRQTDLLVERAEGKLRKAIAGS